jgi:hypothetical protein
MLRLDRVERIVEVGEVAVQDVDGADRQTRFLLVYQGEIDELEQGLAQRCAVVVAGCRPRARKAQPRAWVCRREEAGLAVQDRQP